MRWKLATVLGLGVLGVGCYGTNRCTHETCDGVDDDCDGLIDEGFVDGEGRYTRDEHCGGCNLNCDDVFPSAARTACVVDEAGAHCEITACAEGERMTGDGTCTAEQPVLCLPCEVDLDCELHAPGARCLPDALGGNRCGRMCDSGEDCPPGFRCVADSRTSVPQCEPSTGTCSCTEELIGVEVACLLRADDGHACAGVQRCDAGGLGECMPALSEACNGVDDDCDGVTDEGFVDDAGRYVTEEHCGGCAQACVPSGPNLAASCELDADGDPGCLIECAAGFVDVDGLLVTGCECELTDGPGVVIGGDADCDGEVDETPEFIFVAQTGDDDDTGEDPERPVRTIQRGLERGAATGRDVLVARGIYRGPVELAAGVTVVGGYSPDFRVRDELLHPVVIEDPDGSAGMPMLVCTEIDEPTLIDGFTVVASDAEDTGRGSTAVYLDRCSDAVALQNLTVIAGRGAAGVPGEDSSETIDKWSLSSLGQLAGVDGGSGRAGNELLTACPEVVAGAGGRKTCPRGAVTGGDGGNAICPDLTAVCVNGSAMPCGNSGCTDFTSGGVCDIEAAEAAAEPGTRPAADGMGEGPGQAGALTYPSPTNRVQCSFCDDNPTLSRNGGQGGDGESGGNGVAGEGCDAAETLDLASGRVSAGPGADGVDGGDGSGGGGATAGAGYAVIGNTTGAGVSCSDVSGGSGGGGGSGGCGAPGATGGSGGGASVGVLLRLPNDASQGPSLSGVRVVTASGGAGGDGGIGAAGGPGGAGGLGGLSRFWCARNGGRGGDGGPGGAGGGGGGGCGGSSYGVFVSGTPAADYSQALLDGSLVERAGVAGRGGVGGFSPGNSGGSGRDGSSVDVQLP